ncbi:hypothetical protein GKE73_02060 [Paludibacterium sp. dN 18-1]|uniref:Uncharacterized protein n=1 Tax=Paludibacterium denitrificans TaxID=2675226 RepID=A0A844GCM7_9NEIS|nr:hypothetical protein [Paludibacterium denitrificans]
MMSWPCHWSAAASDPLAFVLGVLRHDLPAADAGVTSRNAEALQPVTA